MARRGTKVGLPDAAGRNETRSMVRRASLVAVMAVLLSTGSASAATASVSMVNYGFNPKNQTVALGNSVVWRNVSTRKHTATPKYGWFWSQVTVRPGATSSPITLTQAGSFPYHCAIHPTKMKGKITVPMGVSPSSGTTATWFTLTLGTVQAPGVEVHDAYIRLNGGAWTLRAATAAPTFTLFFTAPGTWEVHTRLRYQLGGATSGWSPVVAIQVS